MGQVVLAATGSSTDVGIALFGNFHIRTYVGSINVCFQVYDAYYRILQRRHCCSASSFICCTYRGYNRGILGLYRGYTRVI